ncbi:MAG: ArsA family ATPase [Chloroflexota bacterium]|nr:MAG: ArsA family ATPase [Chloroflexota bacterium]
MDKLIILDKLVSSNGNTITMFTGKGGVGKTTCAAATAHHYASLEKETIAISTDATPSLSHLFELTRKEKPAKVKDFLSIHELGMNEVMEMWDKKFGAEVYAVFSSLVSIDYSKFLEFMTSVLPGLSDEFMLDYIKELNEKGEYENIIWDTAPLGQTLSLLETPALLRKHLRMAPRIYSKLRLGHKSKKPIMDILMHWEEASAEIMDFIRERVRFNIVTIPEALAVEQLADTFHKLYEYGFTLQQLIINNVVKRKDSDFLMAKVEQQKSYIETIHDSYSNIKIVELPMFPYELKGLERLKEIENILFKNTR